MLRADVLTLLFSVCLALPAAVGPRYVHASTCTQHPGGLVAWWPADGNTSEIRSGNDGTLLNGATYTSGQVGQAFLFDGVDDRFEAPDSPALHFDTGDFTIVCWIRFADLVNRHNGWLQKDTYDGSGTFKGVVFNICDDCGPGLNGVGFETRNVVSDVGPDNHCRWATSNFSTNQWYLIAGTRASGTLRLYVNGVMRAEVSESEPTDVTNTSVVRFGTLSGISSQAFAGSLDEVAVFDRALSPEEIDGLFQAGSDGMCHTGLPTTTTWSRLVLGSLLALTGGLLMGRVQSSARA